MNMRDDVLRRGDACVAPTTHFRRSLRLPRFDYTRQGAYFVTVCARNRACLFGEIVDGEMRLNDIGRVAHRIWEEIPIHFPQVEIDAWVVMPNHIHGVLVIVGPTVGATHASPLQRPAGPSKRSIGAIVGSYKSAVSKRINAMRGTPGVSVWQRNFYEHVIRNESTLNRIRQYIADNPARWAEDPENPARQSHKEKKA